MVRLATIINGFQPLTTVANLSILDICRTYWLSLLADLLAVPFSTKYVFSTKKQLFSLEWLQ